MAGACPEKETALIGMLARRQLCIRRSNLSVRQSHCCVSSLKDRYQATPPRRWAPPQASISSHAPEPANSRNSISVSDLQSPAPATGPRLLVTTMVLASSGTPASVYPGITGRAEGVGNSSPITNSRQGSRAMWRPEPPAPPHQAVNQVLLSRAFSRRSLRAIRPHLPAAAVVGDDESFET